MSEQSTAASPATAASRGERWLAAGLLAATALAFWPVATWVTARTFAHEQLKQSFFITLLAGVWIAWEQRGALRLRLQLERTGLLCVLAAYAGVAGALLFDAPLLVLAGLVAAAAGAVQILFGERALRRAAPLLAAFGLLIVFVLLFPLLDWPLRKMAGVESARLLQSFGLASHLRIVPEPEVTLLLLNPHGTFVVATECNGFGLISSSLLLGTIFLLYRRAAWWKFPGLLALCLAVAFAMNLLRIATIVGLAPRFPGHYHAMHETAGILALYLGLGAVWLLTGWRPKRR
ncbi:MAG: archaeosortase/exosortase family protein [Opitutaceae bacterium]